YRIDMTEGNIYSISDASKNIVSQLDDKVIVKCFFSQKLPPELQMIPQLVKNNLDEYRTYSNGNLAYEFLDPSSDEFAEQIMQYQLPSAQVQLLEKDEFKLKRVFMGMVLLHEDKKEIIPFIQQGDLPSLEYEITSKIKKLTTDKLPRIGILTEFGTVPVEDMRTVYQMLSSQYSVVPVDADSSSLSTKTIDALLIIGPEKRFSEKALENVDSYIMDGGKTGFFIDKTSVDLKRMGVKKIETGLDSLMMNYGVRVNNDLVGDKQAGTISVRQQKGFFTISNRIKYPFLPKVTNLSKNNIITQNIDAAYFYFASSLDTNFTDKKNVDLEIIARTSENAFTQSDNFYIMADKDIEDYKYDKSSLPIIAILQGSFTSFVNQLQRSFETRMVVSGDSEFFLDNKFGSENDINLFLNLVDWLTADDSLISIRSKNIQLRPLNKVSEKGRLLVKILNVASIPLIILITGIVKWIKRRFRKDFSLKV
ncbi:MAG: GldG family protein, partial [Candidatus Delongbacteria bacterium]